MQIDTFQLHFLLHSADLVEERLRGRLAPLKLKPRQARVIDALARMEPTSQVRLAREFNVSPASMSTMTARLIDAGYVTREIDPNETRAHILRLTAKGRGLLVDIYAAWKDIDAFIAQTLGKTDSNKLSEITRALRDSLGGQAPGAEKDADGA